MTCGIYKIENKINGKCYIGQSINITERWKHHRIAVHSLSSSYEYPLYKEMREYGIENFDFSILEECTKEELSKKEKEYIKKYNSMIPIGYNQIFGTTGFCSASGKLTLQQVNEIKNLLLNNREITEAKIAEMYSVGIDSISAINTGESWKDFDIEYPIRKQYEFFPKFCKKCGKRIDKNSITGFCSKCLSENSLEQLPPREEIKYKIRNLSMCAAAKEYNITDNALRKWCDKYNLPRRKKEINKYSNEEWEKL